MARAAVLVFRFCIRISEIMMEMEIVIHRLFAFTYTGGHHEGKIPSTFLFKRSVI